MDSTTNISVLYACFSMAAHYIFDGVLWTPKMVCVLRLYKHTLFGVLCTLYL